MPALSIWAAVPHYVAQPPCPKATLALLRHIEDLLDVPIPLGDLPDDARAWERGVDELAAEDTEVADYVRSLEEAKDLTDAPEASGDAIAREFERYLRRRGDEPGPSPDPPQRNPAPPSVIMHSGGVEPSPVTCTSGCQSVELDLAALRHCDDASRAGR